MPSTTITITHSKPTKALLPWPTLPPEYRTAAVGLAEVMEAIAGGALDAQFSAVMSSNPGTQAWGTITVPTTSGTVSAIINGAVISVTYATSATNTAALLAAAINASTHALVSGVVSASSSGGVVTIKSFAASKATNSITLGVSGTGVVASGTRLTGGSGQDVSATSYNAPAASSADFTRPGNSDQIAVTFFHF